MIGPRLAARTHVRTTKVNGPQVRVATKRPQGLGGRALGLAHDRALSGVSARKRGRLVRPFTQIDYRSKMH